MATVTFSSLTSNVRRPAGCPSTVPRPPHAERGRRAKHHRPGGTETTVLRHVVKSGGRGRAAVGAPPKRNQPVGPWRPFPSKQHHYFAVIYTARRCALQTARILRLSPHRRDPPRPEERAMRPVPGTRKRRRKEDAKQSDTTGGRGRAERHRHTIHLPRLLRAIRFPWSGAEPSSALLVFERGTRRVTLPGRRNAEPGTPRNAGHEVCPMKVLSGLAIVLCTWCVWPGAGRAIAQSNVSVGSVALLAEQKGVADLRALREAIGHSDSAIRAVAARIAGLFERKELASPLLESLAREQDTLAAREHVRALLYLRGGEILPQAKAAAARLGEPVGLILAEWLGRNQPEQFATTIAELLRDTPGSDTALFGRIAAMAIWQTPSSRDRVTTAFAGAPSRRAWRGFLDYLGSDADARIVKAGLTSSNAAVREATIWFVVSNPTTRRTPATIALAPVLTAEGAVPFPDDTEWAALGRELIARRSGKSGPADGSGAIRRHGLENVADARRLAAAPELTAAEQSALHENLPGLAGRSPCYREACSGPASGREETGKSRSSDVPLNRARFTCQPARQCRVLSVIGYICLWRCENVVSPGRPPARCRARWNEIAGALCGFPQVSDDADGSTAGRADPRGRVAMAAHLHGQGGPQLCRRGHARTFRLRPGRACGGQIKTPRKTSDVKPIYPEAMQLARVTGNVILESTITSTGCVVDARVLRSIQTPLDVAALRAVLGWRFEPTLLDGKPVPVIMTVTVNFTLTQ